MERHPRVTDWQDYFRKNCHLAESNLQIPYNPHQNSNSNIHLVRKTNLQVQNKKKNPRIVKSILNNKRTSNLHKKCMVSVQRRVGI